jgi:hypothetical protein
VRPVNAVGTCTHYQLNKTTMSDCKSSPLSQQFWNLFLRSLQAQQNEEEEEEE